jgi:DNA-binding response OmpR family regulator
MEGKISDAPETVLVVDDERLVRELCVVIIAAGGYRVLAAQDARRSPARTGGCGAILLDLMMPRTSGFDTLQILGQELPDIGGHHDRHSSQSRVIDLLKMGAYDFC